MAQSINLQYELLSDYYYALIGMASSAASKHRQLTDMEINVLVKLCLLRCEGDSLVGLKRVHDEAFGTVLSYSTLRKVKKSLIDKNYLNPVARKFDLKPILCDCGSPVSFSISKLSV